MHERGNGEVNRRGSKAISTLGQHYRSFEELRERAHKYKTMNNPTDYVHRRRKKRPEVDSRASRQGKKWIRPARYHRDENEEEQGKSGLDKGQWYFC